MKNSNTKLIYIKKIDIKEIELIISFDNFEI